MSNEANSNTKKAEMNVFLLITVVMFPLLTVLLVSGYGFSIWIYQLLFGPTGF